MDLCLSCKACKSECPSSVDVAKLKAEFLQHYYDAHGISLRTKLIAYITSLNKMGSILPSFYNFFIKNPVLSRFIKRSVGFAAERSIPALYKTTLKKWISSEFRRNGKEQGGKGRVYLFNDEFTNYNDTEIGIKAIRLLTSLGYDVKIPVHKDSSRTFLSKGLLRKAKQIANKNIDLLKDLITSDTPLVGIEPSAILAFRDEYPDLATPDREKDAQKLAANAFLFEEFILREVEKGNISSDHFTKANEKILLHGHCQQKAVASTEPMKKMLSLPVNFEVKEIPSGCCGMAGSFGYEKEHYDVSMKVGEMVLFPAVREAEEGTLIAAPGTSCRHQIKDGTGVTAYHPLEILFDALVK
jgi:Fe-S oxidoreductase